MDNKKTIKIKMLDFGNDGDIKAQKKHFIIKSLENKYNLEFSDEPDYLFYSVFGNEHHNYDCVRIFFTGENVRPNFNYCDYAIGFDYIDFEDRYARVPLYFFYKGAMEKALIKHLNIKDDCLKEKKFCSFVVSNSKSSNPIRENIFHTLSRYKKVDSGGKLFNNVGGKVSNKLEFQSKYKFSIAFENETSSGYTTEKILEAFASNAIPIYWGSKNITKEFNPGSFINCLDFNSLDEILEYVKKIDNDDNLALKILKTPIYKDGENQYLILQKRLTDFYNNIFEQDVKKARRRVIYQKNYVDIDYKSLKNRDVRNVLVYYIKKSFLRIFRKKQL